MQVPATVLLISDMCFFFYKCGTFIYHNVSNVQGQCRNWWSTTIWQRVMRCAPLPWRHLRQFMRGSLRGGASQIQQTSSTPAATEANRKRQRIAGEGRKEMWERKTERERKQSTALIYVYWFTSLPPHWFQCLLYPFRFHFIWWADIQPGPNKCPTSPFSWC